MGWSSGTELFEKVIKVVKSSASDRHLRRRLYMKLIPAFQEADWDCETECLGIDPAYDGALMTLHPDYFPDEEEDEE